MEARARRAAWRLVIMPSRPEVRDAQRSLAALDAAHTRAVARLNQALTRRAEVVAEQDRQVVEARARVDQAVVTMARAVSVELAAHLLEVEVAEVRRLVRAASAAEQSCEPESQGGADPGPWPVGAHGGAATKAEAS